MYFKLAMNQSRNIIIVLFATVAHIHFWHTQKKKKKKCWSGHSDLANVRFCIMMEVSFPSLLDTVDACVIAVTICELQFIRIKAKTNCTEKL